MGFSCGCFLLIRGEAVGLEERLEHWRSMGALEPREDQAASDHSIPSCTDQVLTQTVSKSLPTQHHFSAEGKWLRNVVNESTSQATLKTLLSITYMCTTYMCIQAPAQM